MARRRAIEPAGAFLLAMCVACAATAGAAELSEYRGLVSEGIAGRLVFQPCAGGAPGPAVALRDDTPGRLLRAGFERANQVRHDADRPMYVEFRAERVEALLRARHFRRAIGHVSSCDAAPLAPPAGARLIAEGAAPSWRLIGSAKDTRLDEPGSKPQHYAALVASPAAEPRAGGKPAPGAARDAPTIVHLTRAGAPGVAVRLELTEQLCSDDAAETAYGARVVAMIGPRRLEGCALRY